MRFKKIVFESWFGVKLILLQQGWTCDGRLSLMPYRGASSSITKGHIINKLVLLLVALTKQHSLISSE